MKLNSKKKHPKISVEEFVELWDMETDAINEFLYWREQLEEDY